MPGVYCSNSIDFTISDILTLNGENNPNAQWIFKTSGTVTTIASSFILENGAQAQNVFWSVGNQPYLITLHHILNSVFDRFQLSNNFF